MIFALLLLFSTPPHYERGITISCEGIGQIWGTDAFADELDLLADKGVTAVSIHPYARIERDGTVRFQFRGHDRTTMVTRPIKEARHRKMRIMIKPHLAYWGNFSWRGAIHFQGEALDRFQKTYRDWILEIAAKASDADYLVVGTELKRLTDDETYWRSLIKDVRELTPARLTYAANWDHYENIEFWDALDDIGIQAYFPISKETVPNRKDLQKGWLELTQSLKNYSKSHNRSVIFTELGYNNNLDAAAEPWAFEQNGGEAGQALQALLLDVSLEAASRQDSWLGGVFLWKWFVGGSRGENFLLNDRHMSQIFENHWQKGPKISPTK